MLEAAEQETADVEPLLKPGVLGTVTYDEWFFAPNGQEFRMAFGPITIIKAVQLFGFQPKNSTNWYAQVGYGERAVLLAGCKIHSAMIGLEPFKHRSMYDARDPF